MIDASGSAPFSGVAIGAAGVSLETVSNVGISIVTAAGLIAGTGGASNEADTPINVTSAMMVSLRTKLIAGDCAASGEGIGSSG